MGDNFLDAANGEAVRLIVVVGRVTLRTDEAQVVTVRSAILRTAPAVTVRALDVERSIGVVAVARSREEDTPNAASSRY
ncbi:MAG: hypothetical protein LBK47_03905 [Prevotellaceae bacterium]|jgi:hypothetical protein|nr:hypothetical protein [Prevotellaceae bacterium]